MMMRMRMRGARRMRSLAAWLREPIDVPYGRVRLLALICIDL